MPTYRTYEEYLQAQGYTRNQNGAYVPPSSNSAGSYTSTGSTTTATSPAALYESLINQYQAAQDRAYAANESRYQQALSGYQQRYARGMANLDTLGQQRDTDINRAADQQKAATNQSAISRGLANTTVRDSLQRGVERDRQYSLNQNAEAVRQQRLNTDATLSGDTLGLIERRQDVYPSMEGLTNLAAQYGASQQQGNAAAVLAANQANYAAQQQSQYNAAQQQQYARQTAAYQQYLLSPQYLYNSFYGYI